MSVLALLALFFTGAPPAHATTYTFPTQDACHATNNTMPVGDCGPFHQVFAENFSGDVVPLGAFSDCDHNADTHQATCNGLTNYGTYRSEFWAYPDGWDDTATQRGLSVHGYYRPQDTIYVGNTPGTTDGAMHLKQWRGSSGSVHSAAVVPKKCWDNAYGAYSAMFKVSTSTGTTNGSGYKGVVLHYWGSGENEADWPEAGYSYSQDPLEAFTHPSEENFSDNAVWFNQPHRITMEWTPNKIVYYEDGHTLGTATRNIASTPTELIYQWESQLNPSGPFAPLNSSVTTDITWMTCYDYIP